MTTSKPAPQRAKELSFRGELRDFWRFLRRPRLSPRLPGHPAGDNWLLDWFAPLPLGRLFLWALVLWAANLFVLGPLAVSVATSHGAQHRLDINNIPWLQAMVWAPLIEELVFRYFLRRPAQIFILMPIALVCLFAGPLWYVQVLLLLCLYLLVSRSAWSARERVPKEQGFSRKLMSALRGRPWSHRQYRRYIRFFPWIFYTFTLAFAALHLYNYQLHSTPWVLLPFLVLPQALTGLALGWLRIRRGIGAAIVLHAIFNSGPLLMVMLIVHLVPNLPT